MSRQVKKTRQPSVTFWGAARTVTGSMHRVDAAGRSVLLDCGLVQGSRGTTFERNREFPFRAKEIDAVLLSHAHVDHCGNLPNLVRQGFKGPIYCTPATRALAGVMLGDSAKVQEEDAEWLNARRGPGEPLVEPLYTGRDVYRTLLQLKAVPYDTPVQIHPGLEATFADAGHLLGSAMLHLRFDTPEGERRLTFTGDLGRPGLPILRNPSEVPPADMLVTESTYGGEHHEAVDETAERLGQIVRATVSRGGKLLIPAFSVGRTQTVIYFLHQLLRAGQLPDVPIYVDSPMAVRATEVFRAHPECYSQATLQLLKDDPDLFGDRQIRYIEKVHESIALNHEPNPCIIVSANGMCEGGRVLYHLQRIATDSRSTVLLTGYQAEGTLGRRLADGEAEVPILGHRYPVRAEVLLLNGLSSHADHAGLLQSLAPLAESVSKVRLVHGEMSRAMRLAESLRAAGFVDVAIPERGEVVPF